MKGEVIEGVTRARILVVEDHRATQRLLQSVLSRAGHDVACISDGRGVVDLVDSFRPHLVLLDIRMPKVDGLQVAEALLTMPDNIRPVLVLVTAYEQTWTELQPTLDQIDGFISKPFTKEDVLAWVDQSLSRRCFE